MCFPFYVSKKFIPEFTVSVSVINTLFTVGKDPGKNGFWLLALADLVARIHGSHPGFPGSIPGQGIKISFHVTTGC